MLRTGIATSEAVAEALKEAGTPLSYGATPESWREAFTTLCGDDETITPRETDGVIGWSSVNETASACINAGESGGATVIRLEKMENKQVATTDAETINLIESLIEDTIETGESVPVKLTAPDADSIEGLAMGEHMAGGNLDRLVVTPDAGLSVCLNPDTDPETGDKFAKFYIMDQS